jgi:Holliday junction DNA helicase RuvA
VFNFICGQVVDKDEGRLVIEAGGIGYEAIATNDALSKTAIGQTVRLYTYLHVKEDGIALYGFSTREEKSVFLKLIAVGGIGPKLAVTVLSGISPRNLALCIVHGDAGALCGIKGVGRKTAERIILELREKMDAEAKELADGGAAGGGGGAGADADAVSALVALGLHRAEAARLVAAVMKPDMTAEQLVTRALKGV